MACRSSASVTSQACLLSRLASHNQGWSLHAASLLYYYDGAQPEIAMSEQQVAMSEASFHAVEAAAPISHAASLLGLPAALLDDIASRTVQLGAGSALSLTCRALSLANLMHALAFHIPVDEQRLYELLTPRVAAALRVRNNKLAHAIFALTQ
ncbi:hypothetical protein QJQ45_002907 [Haematococcus lacustris]|nr:hypothetical protein QJQ45_002907 [Haematococcus lacustris]